VVTGKVPDEGGTGFLAARLPAIASIGMIIRNRPDSIANPSATLYQSVLAFRPANADPLLPVAETKAYSISSSPCGPLLPRLDVTNFETTEIAVGIRIVPHRTRMASIAIFTS